MNSARSSHRDSDGNGVRACVQVAADQVDIELKIKNVSADIKSENEMLHKKVRPPLKTMLGTVLKTMLISYQQGFGLGDRWHASARNFMPISVLPLPKLHADFSPSPAETSCRS
eukprot:115998-Chlamydomonas_euryale.AAC.2